jgi:hypothetical protein
VQQVSVGVPDLDEWMAAEAADRAHHDPDLRPGRPLELELVLVVDDFECAVGRGVVIDVE